MKLVACAILLCFSLMVFHTEAFTAGIGNFGKREILENNLRRVCRYVRDTRGMDRGRMSKQQYQDVREICFK
ncbi:hypothetical protein AC249_AIPGENE25609 [Exaiptasia diaphana]|nr:hypothetical protein AC249_AIPGENE25609 [Exaiptasia diaphana]